MTENECRGSMNRNGRITRVSALEDIGDELGGLRAGGAFGREEFGSEVPKHCHPYHTR